MHVRRVVSRLLWLAMGAGAVALVYSLSPVQNLSLMYRLWSQPLQGPLRVPVEGVRASGLADTWGAGRGGGRRHEGIDIFARCGRPVLSATEGIVLRIGENTLGGMTVRVLGPGGSMHYYAHLSRYAPIRVGDHVLTGDVLGHVGNTGNAAGTPCHLHYGIYLGGQARNPYPYLAPEATPAPRERPRAP